MVRDYLEYPSPITINSKFTNYQVDFVVCGTSDVYSGRKVAHIKYPSNLSDWFGDD